ncbi:MAG TPA: hypothetical protein VLM38_18615 [Blastocatellia bacterium]|nr:hypothetical protein [Blastocatellia bacterium]
MQSRRSAVLPLPIVILLASWAFVPGSQLPMEPAHESGQSITGAFEGWFGNPDGSFSLLLGYYNRNTKVELDIPIGPNNRIEPGGPDQGQPTHFLTGRQWGLFTVTVPKDFGTKKLTWTLTVNGQTTVIPMSLNPLWEVSPFIEASGNTPPFISFEEGKLGVQGPRGSSATLGTTLPNPLTLTVWVADDAKAPRSATQGLRNAPVTVSWSKFRGPGRVTFANIRPTVEKTESKVTPAPAFIGKATTTATFSEPGQYVLRLVANDASGDGGRGFQCCWSNAQVKVAVKPEVANGR